MTGSTRVLSAIGRDYHLLKICLSEGSIIQERVTEFIHVTNIIYVMNKLLIHLIIPK